MKCRSLLSGVLMIALTCMTATAQAQGFGESSDDEEETESSAPEPASSSTTSSTTSSSTTTSSSASAGSTGEANSLNSGAYSLSFAVPGGGNPYANGAVGFWYMITDNINLGINLGLGIEATETINGYNTDAEDSTSTTAFDLLLAPAMRYYLFNTDSVAPYILGQLNFHKFFDDNDDTTADLDDDNNAYNSELQPELALIGGFGLEWFPVEQFSVGGHVGLGIDILRQHDAPAQTEGATVTKNGFRIGTFTSALTANLYFY